MTFEAVREALSRIADDLPVEIYDELNGGIILSPDTVNHAQYHELYVLGEYHYEPRGLGRYITVYYGSFLRTYGGLSAEMQLEKLKSVLHHELTHHLEHLAGDRSLEKEDAAFLENYRSSSS